MSMYKKVLTIAFMATLVGCTAAPIHNVDNAAVVGGTSQNKLSSTQVRAAIIRAGASLGWVMKDSDPNKLTGTLHLRTHTAVVDIPYSPDAYSIKYVSSVNLEENAGLIHKNYNGWISNLTRAIDVQLAAQH